MKNVRVEKYMYIPGSVLQSGVGMSHARTTDGSKVTAVL